MEEKKRRPIRKKVQNIVLGISALALLITSTIGIFSMVVIQRESEDALILQMEQNVRNIITSKAELAESELGKFAGYVDEFARYAHELYVSSKDVGRVEVLPSRGENAGRYVNQRLFSDRRITPESVHDELSLLGNMSRIWETVIPPNKGLITTVYIGTERGFMIAYDDQSFDPEDGETEDYYDFQDSAWYRRARRRKAICFTDVYQDTYGRGPTITCASPFYDAEGKFAGVVGMDILISDLYRAVVSLELDERAYAFIADGAGRIISRPSEVSGDAGTIYQNPDISRPVADNIASGNTGISHTDNKIYYAYTPIPSTGWKLCLKIPQAVILQSVSSMNRDIILTICLFVLSFLVILVVVWFAVHSFSARLTSPIIQLGHDAEIISRGQLDYRAEIHDNDEIGDLAQGFNEMARSLKEYIANLAAVTAEKERIGAELNIATQIQADMLPRIFPPFPGRNEFDIYATMTPAKEVGGDFYDFFMIDDDHLALVMADVSGKGVPAALFMVIAKTLIKNRAQMGGTPSEILADVNEQLCEGNEAELFVTVWLGILEISTGKVKASNAGHEYPAIYRPGEGYTLFKTKQSPAVATMEGLRFRESEFTLNPGDSLYVYTDGVAEATNSSNELFGTDRMIECLDGTVNMTVGEVLSAMKEAVDEFTGDAPQFDDITMLALRYYGKC